MVSAAKCCHLQAVLVVGLLILVGGRRVHQDARFDASPTVRAVEETSNPIFVKPSEALAKFLLSLNPGVATSFPGRRAFSSIPLLEATAPVIRKLICTSMSLLVFLLFSKIPLWGAARSKADDQFQWLRVILASSRGSLTELGITPVVITSMIKQVLSGSAPLHNLVGTLVTVAQAVGFVMSGMCGKLGDLGGRNAMLIVMQLSLSSTIIALITQFLEKGCGFCSGIPLFIAANLCECMIWKFSLNPSIWVAPVLLVLTAPYFYGFRVELPVKYKNSSGLEGKYPIKLFHDSYIPIVFQALLTTNLKFVSKLIQRLRMLIRRVPVGDASGQTNLDGGLAYYISPPNHLSDIWRDPGHMMFYVTFKIVSCMFFNKCWTSISGHASHDVLNEFREKQMVLKGHRDANMLKVLDMYIPTAAAVGGMMLGVLTIIAEVFGAGGSGMGALISVTIICQYLQSLQEKQAWKIPQHAGMREEQESGKTSTQSVDGTDENTEVVREEGEILEGNGDEGQVTLNEEGKFQQEKEEKERSEEGQSENRTDEETGESAIEQTVVENAGEEGGVSARDEHEETHTPVEEKELEEEMEETPKEIGMKEFKPVSGAEEDIGQDPTEKIIVENTTGEGALGGEWREANVTLVQKKELHEESREEEAGTEEKEKGRVGE